MSLAVRRLVYSLLALLGFTLMVPLFINTRRLQTQWLEAPETVLDSSAAALGAPTLLFLVGLILASCFLYAALSAGYPRAWKPDEEGAPRCRRCGGALNFGVARCPTCDQQLAW